MRVLVTAGQANDSPPAPDLIKDYEFEALIADKAYDAEKLVKEVEGKGAKAVIPPRRNRLEQREYDQHWYKRRHLIECLINKLKQYRRVFSRFEKLSNNYLSFVQFVGALIWLR